MPNRNTRKPNAFTLIEIMVVIAILGILITSFLANFKHARQLANDSKRKNDLRQIAVSLESYFNDFEAYPDNDANGKINGCGANDALTPCEWGQAFALTHTASGNTVTYMPQIPRDPAPTKYTYTYDRVGPSTTTFKLYAFIENTDDADYHSYTGISCGTGVTCTYAITSPNTKPF